MADLDYYSVMQKRIEYFANKYDPSNRIVVKKEESYPLEIMERKPKKLRKKIQTAYTNFISMLF